MADIQVANTDADLSGNTVVTEENTYTITGLHTYSRGSNAPFACITGSAYVQFLDADKVDGVEAAALLRVDGSLALSANWDVGAFKITGTQFVSDISTGTAPFEVSSTTVVANLNADKLDGQEGAYYLAAANATGTLAVNRGGTGAATFTDGGVLLGSGTSAITATAVLGDGVILIGDASGDPTTLDVGSSSGITILGTIATGVWNGTAVAAAYGGTGQTSYTAGDLTYASGVAAISKLGIGANTNVLTSNGSLPQWSTRIGNAAMPTNVDLGGTLDVTGATTLDSTLTVVNDVAVDTDTLFVDVSADRVGIGTTAPGTAVAATKLVHSINCVRAWGVVTQTSGGATLNAGFNCSVGRDSIGDTDVTLTPWASHSNDYCVVVTIIGNTHSQTAYAYNHGTGGFKILCYNGTSLADLKYSFTVIGD